AQDADAAQRDEASVRAVGRFGRHVGADVGVHVAAAARRAATGHATSPAAAVLAAAAGALAPHQPSDLTAREHHEREQARGARRLTATHAPSFYRRKP